MAASFKIGYCTNIHAGVTLAQVKENLAENAVAVKRKFSPTENMGVGLWLTHQAAEELLHDQGTQPFCDWLQEKGLEPFTFNAFPYSDFHQDRVKHQVYLPTWAEKSRLEYTLKIAHIQSRLLSEGEFGSISTLPLAWPHDSSSEFLEACSKNLVSCARQLKAIEEDTSRHIFLCLEPEPGCLLETSTDVVDYFNRYLFDTDTQTADLVRQHIGVCHDVCHAAVMREKQQDALKRYEDNGIAIGKFQISSAIKVDFRNANSATKQKQIYELQNFAEDRYLHQTVISNGKQDCFYADLPDALNKNPEPDGIWTVHFHVPIYLNSIGTLGTTFGEIESVLDWVKRRSSSFPLHFEVETYAWSVMPNSQRNQSLVDVVSNELQHLTKLLQGKTD